jgi:hypothetical protein
MSTVRAALETLEAGLFVDRQVESEEFRNWLSADSPDREILQVVGHAGVGKSALLRAFARMAPALDGRAVVRVDGETISPTPNEFAMAVTGDGLLDPATYLGAQPALLMIDGMDELAPLTRWMTKDLIPSLNPKVRVVMAGRQSVGPMWKPWLRSMRTISLDTLPRHAARAYLERRGVSSAVADQIVETTGGYPLGLTLAADLAIRRGVTHFKKAPEWHLTLAGLVEEMVKNAPDLRSLLEAGAVVRQFDESTLAAVSGIDRAGDAFAELSGLTFVHATQHGLALHEDIRRVVMDELQWRNPERLAQLRRRARTYYRDRIRERRRDEQWLVAERIYLWDHSVHAVYFPAGELSTMWVEPGRADDIEELLAIQSEWVGMLEAGIPLPVLPPPEECSPEFLRAIVALPGTQITIARSPDGQAHAYVFMLPLSQESVALLPHGGAIANVVERGLPDAVRHALPPGSEGSRALYMSTIVARGERALEAGGALAADSYRMALRGGLFLACTGDETYAMTLKALGATPVPGVGTSSVGAPRPLDGYIIDITSIGPEAWLEAVTSGTPLPPRLSTEEFQQELHQVLVGWNDDARLARSPLAQLAVLMAPADATSPADSVRAMVLGALTEVRAVGTDESELACRAIELAYLERKLAHDAIAERLNVSRSTFYRLLHRAERGIAARLTGSGA